MLNWLRKWWNPEPVYSEVGQRLWELVQKFEEWEQYSGLCWTHKPTGLYLNGLKYLRVATWPWQSERGVSCFAFETSDNGNIETRDLLGLSVDDHKRLYDVLAFWTDRKAKGDRVWEKAKGERFFK